MGGSVTTAVYSAQGIVGMGLFVITWLASVTEGVRLDGKDLFVIKSVITGPMDTTVWTTVVVTVWTTLHVTNRLGSVTWVVTRVTPTGIVANIVHMDILEWDAEDYVVDIV